jgi:uroporphyrinogen-III synthase
MEAISYPLFMIVPLPWTGPEPHLVDALMFTSANGVRHGGGQLERYRHLPAFAVGEATGEAARAAGFADVRVGNEGAAALGAVVRGSGLRRILHVSGRDVRLFDPGPLKLFSACVYAAVESGNAEELAERLARVDAVMVHSPRAGQRLAELTTPIQRAAVDLFAISAPAAQAVGGGWRCILTAERPTDDAMLALRHGLCE